MSQRIGYLTSQYPAPSHTFIRREVEALREQGVELETFSVRPPKEEEVFSEMEREERDRTFYVLPPAPLPIARSVARALVKRPRAFVRTLREAFEHRPPGTKGAAYAGVYFLEAMHLAEALDERGIDHLHNHFANAAAIVGHLATSYLDIDWSFTVHGISEFDYPAGLLLGDKIKNAKFVACVSHFGRSQALRTVDPSAGDKMIIVRCGVDLSQMPARRPRDDGRFRFVCVARLSPEKAHLGLLEAFEQVARERPEADLWFVGEGPERAKIEAAIAQRGLGDRVRLLGHMTERDVLAQVAEADALVVSSLMEGLPVVLMEAMAIGVPVVAPSVGGIPELVEHDVTGLIFTVSSWKGLASRMLALASDRALGERLAEAGRRRIEEEFDVRRAVAPLKSRFG
ncbi:MAG: glycosyltransferase family 4 protein [Sandaracinus sp.]|nr:glycosyltransferase family 4 protein [Sandaracinus sp.]